MRTTLLLGAVLLLPGLAMADAILEYDISKSKRSTISATGVEDGITVSDMTATGVSVLTGYKGTYCSTNWGGDEVDYSKYYEFSVTPDEGLGVTYDSMSLSLLRGDYDNDVHGAQKWVLYASIDGFTGMDNEILIAEFDLSDTGADVMTLFENIDLSVLGTQTGTITFRLYGYDDTSNGTDYAGFGDTTKYGLSGTGSSVTLYGSVNSMPDPLTASSVSVPEPSVLALLGIGGLSLALQRKCRHRSTN